MPLYQSNLAASSCRGARIYACKKRGSNTGISRPTAGRLAKKSFTMIMSRFSKTNCRTCQPHRAMALLAGRRRLRPAITLLGWLGVGAAILLGYGEARAPVISRVSAPGKFYVDDKASIGVLYNYAAYIISNDTATTFPSVYVAITNIASTNLIQLGTSDTGVRALGAIAPGQAKLAAFYLKGPSFTGNSQTLLNLTNENHTIVTLNGPPGVGSALTS